jgi:hypothetical protein
MRTPEEENWMSAPMAAGLLLKLKEECEAQHARAEAAEAALRAYGQHKPECELVVTIHRPELWDESNRVIRGESVVPDEEKHCTCGFAAVLGSPRK